MYKPPYKITSKILNLVSQISEIVGKLELLELQKQPLLLRKINKIKTISSTVQIEGNTLTEEEVSTIIEGKNVLAPYKEILEVKNSYKLYEKIDNFDYKSVKDLLKAHKILMNKLIKDAGVFRNVNVKVASHIAPPPLQVPKLIDELFTWLKKSNEHLLIKASVFHFEFEFIHPFSDGNGRLGRFWQSLILKEYKQIFEYIPIESLIKQTQNEYYRALEISGEKGDSTYFIEYILSLILISCKEILNDPLKVPKNDPKKRLKNIIEYIKKNPKITIKELSLLLRVSEKTIKRDIDKLKLKNLIKRVGKKGGYWEIIKQDKK